MASGDVPDTPTPDSVMTRSDLVEALASRFSQLTHRDAEFAVKAILDAMGDALVKGHRIEIRGFGSFSVNRRSPRIGRNPRSGEKVMIPEKRVPHFKPGKALREQVDAKTPEILAREPKKPD
jgi:integration host factor subunit beta